MSNVERALKLAREKGLDLAPLLENAQQENVKALRAVRTLMKKCKKKPELRSAVLDAIPRNSLVDFIIHMNDYDRIQIAAALLYLGREHFGEVREFLKWLKLPQVDNYESLRMLMRNWIVTEN